MVNGAEVIPAEEDRSHMRNSLGWDQKLNNVELLNNSQMTFLLRFLNVISEFRLFSDVAKVKNTF